MSPATTPRRPRLKTIQTSLNSANVSLGTIHPSPENDKLYSPVDPSDPDFKALVESIRQRGVLEPIVVTLDGYIVSGHRRYAAAKNAGLNVVPVRYESIRRLDDIDQFVVRLREFNRQRNKTFAEKVREELVTIDPHECYQALIDHRNELEQSAPDLVRIDGHKHRAGIGRLKQPMLNAALKIILKDRLNYWPLSIRGIHYALLNENVLRNADREDSLYVNDRKSYQDLSNLLTRARLSGLVPWAAINDETRPSNTWKVWKNPQAFIQNELSQFLKGYWRDLMQSQPNHVEVICEKNTVFSIIKQVTSTYRIPTLSGRGFCSLDPYHVIVNRYRRSGKGRLVVIVASDFDPEGEEIVQVAGRTLRDDFGIRRLDVLKAAITTEQITELQLPPMLEAKESSSRYTKFTTRHGTTVHELEALTPEQLQEAVTATIDSVIDITAFNVEVEAEVADAAHLEGTRRAVFDALKDLSLDVVEK